MKLYVLDNGKIVMQGANPVLQERTDAAEAPAIPIHSFLLDSPAGKILFDTACHPDAMRGAWPKALHTNPYVYSKEQGLLARLAQIGVQPQDVDIVVLSHLHLDHAGGAHFFPDAKVYVSEQELSQVMQDAQAGTLDMFHLPCDVENWEKADLKWTPVPPEVKELSLCEGVTLLNLGPGHSFGMLGLAVELQCGTFLLVSDAVYCREHYGPPPQLSGAVYDEQGYFATMEYLRTYAQEHHAQILYGHDMEQFCSLTLSPDGSYE